jgi:multiple sugar transport system substrate-binding protein
MTSRNQPFSRRSVLKAGALAGLALPLAAYSRGAFAADKKLSVMFLGPSSATVDAVKNTILPAFSDKTGYAVEFQQSDWGSGFQKVTTAAASGTLADVIMLGGIWTAPLASKNALLALDDFFADYADKANFYPSMVQDCAYQGKTYGLPLYSDTRTSLYRKDLLAAVGVGEDALPGTWDDYRALGEKVKAGGGSAAGSPIYWNHDKSIGLQQSFAQLILQAGGTYWKEDGSAQFSSDPCVAALDYLVSCFKDQLSDVNQVYSGAGPNPVVAGASVTHFGGVSTVTNARANAPDIVAQLIAGPPLASAKGGKPTTTAWVNKLAISARTKDRDGAWQLLQHLVNHDSSEKLAELYGGLPARSDLANAAYLKDIPAGLPAAAPYVVTQPAHPNMLIIGPTINTAVEKAVRMQADVKTVLAELDDKLNEINGV